MRRTARSRDPIDGPAAALRAGPPSLRPAGSARRCGRDARRAPGRTPFIGPPRVRVGGASLGGEACEDGHGLLGIDRAVDLDRQGGSATSLRGTGGRGRGGGPGGGGPPRGLRRPPQRPVVLRHPRAMAPGGAVLASGTARPTPGEAEAVHRHADRPAPPGRAQKSRSAISLGASASSSLSATSRFGRAFSFSISFGRPTSAVFHAAVLVAPAAQGPLGDLQRLRGLADGGVPLPLHLRRSSSAHRRGLEGLPERADRIQGVGSELLPRRLEARPARHRSRPDSTSFATPTSPTYAPPGSMTQTSPRWRATPSRR